MNSKYNGSMGYQRLIKEIKRDVGGGPPGPDSVGTSQIINASVTKDDLSTQLQDFIDGTKTVLSVSKINLIIHNLDTGNKALPYSIRFTDENSNVTNYYTSGVSIPHGTSHSILLSIATALSTTSISFAIDTTDGAVDEYSIYNGATEIDWNTEVGLATLSFISDESPNIEIGFKMVPH